MAAEDVFRPDIPSPARMYDYFLGGKNNYPADREAGEKLIRTMPPGSVRAAARQNREFLGRAVRFLTQEAGVSQLFDIGTGLPTMNQVHQVAGPDAHVVYVDNDPIVLIHARDMLEGEPNTTIIRGDLRRPYGILDDPELHELIDFGKPVALLLVAILHFIRDEEDPAGLVAALAEKLAPGSYLVISHGTNDTYARAATIAQNVYSKATSNLYTRGRAQIAGLFTGFDLLPPGLVSPPEWRPDLEPHPARDETPSLIWCGVARKH